ncbi:MAG: 30S ribosomal protein S6 [Myxococcota bacterium]
MSQMQEQEQQPRQMLLREYETVFMAGAELAEDGVQALFARVREAIEKGGGTVLREDSWGKRKLAYDVNKVGRAVYLVVHYAAPSATVFEVERSLRNSDVVTRFTTNRFGAVDDLDAKRADVEKMMREQAARRAEEQRRQQEAATEAESRSAQEAESRSAQDEDARERGSDADGGRE